MQATTTKKPKAAQLRWPIMVRGEDVPPEPVTLPVFWREQGYIAIFRGCKHWVRHDPNGQPFIEAWRPIPARELEWGRE